MGDSSGVLTPYREIADVLANLGLILREARRARGLSTREAARQLGMSFATVGRIEQGEDYMIGNARRVLAWLDQGPAEVRIRAELAESERKAAAGVVGRKAARDERRTAR
jgi:transcriptional regulator with XRE-family HTH domain